MACMCMGPQRGEPLCPCMMRAAGAHKSDNAFVPPPLDLGALFDDILVLARDSKDEEALQYAIDMVATASCRSLDF